jgi:uncharacterized protein
LPDVICNTSPLQYLHQLGLLHVLPALVQFITVPPAVVEELEEGRLRGVDVPNPKSLGWIRVRIPASITALPLVHDLGQGETEVLMLALESPGSTVLIDDRAARETARILKIPFRGTLGVLLDAKKMGHLQSVAPLLDRLQALGFWLAPRTRDAVLDLAGEMPDRT